MKGNNELRLNEATVVEALQEYLAKRYTPTPKVESISADSKIYDGSWFIVKLSEVEAPKP